MALQSSVTLPWRTESANCGARAIQAGPARGYVRPRGAEAPQRSRLDFQRAYMAVLYVFFCTLQDSLNDNGGNAARQSGSGSAGGQAGGSGSGGGGAADSTSSLRPMLSRQSGREDSLSSTLSAILMRDSAQPRAALSQPNGRQHAVQDPWHDSWDDADDGDDDDGDDDNDEFATDGVALVEPARSAPLVGCGAAATGGSDSTAPPLVRKSLSLDEKRSGDDSKSNHVQLLPQLSNNDRCAFCYLPKQTKVYKVLCFSVQQ